MTAAKPRKAKVAPTGPKRLNPADERAIDKALAAERGELPTPTPRPQGCGKLVTIAGGDGTDKRIVCGGNAHVRCFRCRVATVVT